MTIARARGGRGGGWGTAVCVSTGRRGMHNHRATCAAATVSVMAGGSVTALPGASVRWRCHCNASGTSVRPIHPTHPIHPKAPRAGSVDTRPPAACRLHPSIAHAHMSHAICAPPQAPPPGSGVNPGKRTKMTSPQQWKRPGSLATHMRRQPHRTTPELASTIPNHFGLSVHRSISVLSVCGSRSQAKDHGLGTMQRCCVPDQTPHTLSP